MKGKSLIKLSFLLLILFSFTQCKKEKSNIIYDRKYLDEIKAARDNIWLYMGTNYIPGGTFAIAKEGKIIYSEGLGLASKDLEVPVTRNTKFRIGDLSSLFTNMMFYRLQKEGVLHKDSSAHYYYPEFTKKIYDVKLHHLVQQTSGIRNPNVKESDWRGLNVTLKKGVEIFQADSLIAIPGWYQEYNPFNYNLLGAIMEKTTGERFPNLLEKYITDTLNLENTMVDNPLIPVKGRTDFFDKNYVAHIINATSRDMRYRAPSQGLLSNAEDLVKFGNALLYSDYFKEVIDENFFEPILLYNDIPSFMANEWILLTDKQNRKIYGKIGTVTGGSAAILVYPDEKLVLACATNLTGVEDSNPLFEMAAHFLENEEDKSENEEQSNSDAEKP